MTAMTSAPELDVKININESLLSSNLHIQVIDDDSTSLQGLITALQSNGYRADGFENPRQAIQSYSAHPYDVVITDYKMPDMDGIDVLKTIRAINAKGPIHFLNVGA